MILEFFYKYEWAFFELRLTAPEDYGIILSCRLSQPCMHDISRQCATLPKKKNESCLNTTEDSVMTNMFDITAFGAVGDGATDNTAAIQAALDAASASLYAAGDAQAFCEAFAARLPFAPLLRQSGMVSYVRNLQHTAPTALQPFPQIRQWKF